MTGNDSKTKKQKKKNESGKEGVTIVGGRPMHRAVSAEDLPVGVEQALTMAALDHRFRQRLQEDPVSATKEKGIRLDTVEAQLLASADPETLSQMARRTVSPPRKGTSRRRFMKNVAASVAVLVGGKAFLLCSGCTGADTWEPHYDAGSDAGSDDESRATRGAFGPTQKWAVLSGYTCYLYQPESALEKGLANTPLLVALSDEDETCLSSVQRWTGAAKHYGFSILAVNWTEAPLSQAQRQELSDALPRIVDEYEEEYAYDRRRCHLCSHGASTDMVARAGFDGAPHRWASLIFLGGVPQKSCGALVEGGGSHTQPPPPPAAGGLHLPALYYVIGRDDPQNAAAMDCAQELRSMDIDIKVHQVEGRSDTAVLRFSTLWEWASRHQTAD